MTFHFPPDGSVGGLRWAGMSKYLVPAGWEVHVVTAAAQTGPSLPGVTIHQCARSSTVNDWYNSLVGRLRSRRRSTGVSAGSASQAAAVTSGPPQAPVATGAAGLNPQGGHPRVGPIKWMRNSLGAALAFPDFGRGWIFKSAGLARKLLNEQSFDAIVSSGPPHSAHIAAAIASWGRSEPFWVDMRDPWFSHFSPPRGTTSGRKFGVPNPHLLLERIVMGRADRVITNTSKFYEIFRACYPAVKASFIPNGIDRDRLPARAAKFSGFSIAYAGTVYLSRNLSPILRALPAVLSAIPGARESLKLRIAGSMDSEHEARFHDEVSRLGLTPLVEARGRVLNAEAMDLVNRSHLALVLAQDQPAQIPAKIYECVAMGVPTLVIAESTSAAANEARRIGAMTCEPDDIVGIERLLERLWQNPASTDLVSNAPIGYEVIASEMDALFRSDLGEVSAAAIEPLAAVQETSVIN